MCQAVLQLFFRQASCVSSVSSNGAAWCHPAFSPYQPATLLQAASHMHQRVFLLFVHLCYSLCLCTLHIIAGLTDDCNLGCVVHLQAGQIVDDELNNWLVNPLPQGVILHCVIDACHSGSVMDLPYRSKIKYGKPVWKNEYTAPTRRFKVRTLKWDASSLHQMQA